ncbi:MAG: beta-ketoacyl-ACP synthase [Cyanobacteria bacterium RYN_339]|nr:beta-ketoacyl-ACP synthase [Cyanobacteria bacterium RYN_339]
MRAARPDNLTMQRNVKILGTGRYLPGQPVGAVELGQRLGLEAGWIESRSGVLTRYFVKDETSSLMGARAAQAALDDAGLTFADIDCMVCTAGAPEQVIPCTAALIQKQMGQADSGVACFDINSTCLSFLTGLDTLSYLVAAGRYRRVLVVATEIASVALNWNDRESATIFGDAAAAVVIGATPEGEPSAILAARQETYSAGAHLTQARGGGTKHHPRNYAGTLAEYTDEYCLFEMDGKAVFKLSAQVLPAFVERTLAPAGLTLDDINLVVPHQASMTALGLIQRRLGLSNDRWMVIAPEFGNTIAASLPLALHEAITRGRARRGDKVMLLGTSAGFSVGALALVY